LPELHGVCLTVFSAQQAGKQGSPRGSFIPKHSFRTVLFQFALALRVRTSGYGAACSHLRAGSRCISLPASIALSSQMGPKAMTLDAHPRLLCLQVGLQVVLQPAVQNVLARTAWCVASHASPAVVPVMYWPLNDLRSRSLAVGVAYPVYASARVLEQPASSPERAERLPHWLRRGAPAVPRKCTGHGRLCGAPCARQYEGRCGAAIEEHSPKQVSACVGTGACSRVFRRRRLRSCSASRATTTSSFCCCCGCKPSATRAQRACSACCCALRCTSCGPALRHFLRAPRHWRCAASAPVACT